MSEDDEENRVDLEKTTKNIQRQLARELYDRAIEEGKIVPPPTTSWEDEDDK